MPPSPQRGDLSWEHWVLEKRFHLSHWLQMADFDLVKGLNYCNHRLRNFRCIFGFHCSCFKELWSVWIFVKGEIDLLFKKFRNGMDLISTE